MKYQAHIFHPMITLECCRDNQDLIILIISLWSREVFRYLFFGSPIETLLQYKAKSKYKGKIKALCPTDCP